MADDEDCADIDLLQQPKVDVDYFPSAYFGVDDGASPDFEFSFDFSASACLDQLPRFGHEMLSAEELFYNGKLRSSPLVTTTTATAASTAPGEVCAHEEPDRDSIVATAWANFNESLAMAMAADVTGDNEQLSLVGFGLDPAPPPPMATSAASASIARRVQVRSLDDGLAMHMLMSNNVNQNHLSTRLSENPRCISMSSADDDGGGGGGAISSCRPTHRSCVSLSNSRCSSPSRSASTSAAAVPIIPLTFSQPLTRTVAASVLADFDVARDIDSAAASHRHPAASNYHRKRAAAAAHAAQPRSSSKLLDFFRLRRHHKLSIDATANPRSFFWPFSRSNSAGLPAATSTHSLLPPATHLPRRSNSAGESKTTSSSLLPSHVRRNVAAAAGATHARPQVRLQQGNIGATSLAGARSSVNGEQHRMRRGEPASNITGNSHGKQQQQQPRAAATLGPRPHVRYVPTSCRNKAAEESSYGMGISGATTSSPGRQATSRKMASAAAAGGRVSPGRQGSGSSGGRSSAAAAAGSRSSGNHHHNYPMAKTHHHLLVRPKDMLMASTTSGGSSSNCRDPASTIRITPVLNVPACITPSSKSKIFNNLGNLFSKKDKVFRGGYSILPAVGPPHDSTHLLSGA